MSQKTLKKLEHFKDEHHLTDTALAKRLMVHRNYLFRWRKSRRITGAYERIIEGFLKDNKNGR